MTTLEQTLTARERWDGATAAGMRYVRSCRNREKRAYALAYLAHLIAPDRWPVPSTACYALSYMGAQAVRLSLAEAVKGGA